MPLCVRRNFPGAHRPLVFGAADPSQGCAGSVYRIPEDPPAFVHFCKTDAGVLEDECQALLDDFLTKVREVRQKPFPNPPDVGIMI
jgi:tRNA(Arg) A34 adenosine deaminase TadA